MINVMSKLLLLGMSLEEVIKRSTWNMVKISGHTELGHLFEGAVADIAVLDIRHGNFGLVDAGGYHLNAQRNLQGELTIKGGEITYDLNGISRPRWEPNGRVPRVEVLHSPSMPQERR